MSRVKIVLPADELTIEYNNDKKTKDLIFGKLLAFYIEHSSFCGESLVQNDNACTCAIDVLAEIAEEAFKFEWEYNDD